MAMSRIFRVFCINCIGLGPLHYISSHSDFGFEFAEIFVYEKWLPVSVSRGVDKISYWYNYFQTWNNSILIVITSLANFWPHGSFKGMLQPFKVLKMDAKLIFFHRITNKRSRRPSDSPIRGVGDSPYRRYAETATLRLNDTGSRRRYVSPIQRVFF